MALVARSVGCYEDSSGAYVSTVFLVADHNFSGEGPLLLWDTVIRESPLHDGWERRYTSRRAAERGHAAWAFRLIEDLKESVVGCDIHTKVEVRRNGSWVEGGPQYTYTWGYPGGQEEPCNIFEFNRNYGLLAALAGIRNHAEVPPFKAPTGLPEDVSEPVREWAVHGDYHSRTSYTLLEFLLFNYDARFIDKRLIKQGESGELTTYRAFLPRYFFEHVEALRKWAEENGVDPEDMRVIIAFDN